MRSVGTPIKPEVSIPITILTGLPFPTLTLLTLDVLTVESAQVRVSHGISIPQAEKPVKDELVMGWNFN